MDSEDQGGGEVVDERQVFGMFDEPVLFYYPIYKGIVNSNLCLIWAVIVWKSVK